MLSSLIKKFQPFFKTLLSVHRDLNFGGWVEIQRKVTLQNGHPFHPNVTLFNRLINRYLFFDRKGILVRIVS